MTPDREPGAKKMNEAIEELIAERDEARLLVARGMFCAITLGTYVEELGYEVEDGTRAAAAHSDFMGPILDNHVPWSEWGRPGPELAALMTAEPSDA